jgi:GT2 family glycosyltransferase
MKLSIVIVNWNTEALLRDCLASVFTYPPDCAFDVWVVDNASSDDSVAMVKRCFPQVHLIESDKNLGFAQGNNLAVNQIHSELVLLLNSDTVVKSESLTTLVEFMDAWPEAGAAGSMLLNPDESLQPSCHPSPKLGREIWRLLYLDLLYPIGRYHMHKWDQTEPREVDVVQGAAMILRQHILDKIGLLDGDYFMYSEEVDLCYRLQKAGWRLYWVPQSKVIHYGGQSTKQIAEEMFLQLYKGKLMYFRKHYGRNAGWQYKLILLFISLVRLSLSPLTLLESQQTRQQHHILLGRYWQLIRALPNM